LIVPDDEKGIEGDAELVVVDVGDVLDVDADADLSLLILIGKIELGIVGRNADRLALGTDFQFAGRQVDLLAEFFFELVFHFVLVVMVMVVTGLIEQGRNLESPKMSERETEKEVKKHLLNRHLWSISSTFYAHVFLYESAFILSPKPKRN